VPVLSAADVASLRALAESVMPDTYELLVSGDGGSDGEGGTIVGPETVAETGPCDLAAGGRLPQDRVIASQAGAQALYRIELPYATAARGGRGQRLRVNGARLFEVVAVEKEGATGITAAAICQEHS
jgi:hypothetical protein